VARGGGGWRVVRGLRSGAQFPGQRAAFRFDLTDEQTVGAAADSLRDDPPRLVIVSTGALTLPGGHGPEKSYRQIEAAAMAETFAINAIGPALIAKHVLPLMPKEGRSVFAALGARVGSIGDNRLGGWHSYRASKAAMAMLLRNFAIEMAHTHPQAIVAGLHPGTGATPLSAPFRKEDAPNVLPPTESARHLLDVIAGLGPADSGGSFDWNGASIPP